MSYLANAIVQLLNEHGMIAADLARLTGLTPAQISRWQTGEQISIKSGCLMQLAKGFPEVAESHARLLFATLNDACSEPGKTYITVSLSLGSQVIQANSSKNGPLAPSVQKDLETIARGSRNRKIRDLLHAFANMCDCRKLNRQNLSPLFDCSSTVNGDSFVPSTLADKRSETSASQFEAPIRSAEARRILSIGSSKMSAIKRKMGLKGHKYIMLSEIQKWRQQNPNFQENEVYHRPSCNCANCIAKRALPNRRGRASRRNVKQVNPMG